jgi:hypothetical protein
MEAFVTLSLSPSKNIHQSNAGNSLTVLIFKQYKLDIIMYNILKYTDLRSLNYVPKWIKRRDMFLQI